VFQNTDDIASLSMVLGAAITFIM